MTAEILSGAWAAAWRDALNASEAYRAAAASWEGTVVAVVRADPGRGIESRAVFLDLWHGSCRDARLASDRDIEAARYVLTASPSAWAELLGGTLDPIAAVMSGRLELTKGSVMALLPHVAAARELLVTAWALGAPPPEWSAR
ncbi:MAG TPA: SCP2 sterol-binding domain-containing protein [Thermoanaerobaculaceae bacterium]|nr:SCP2 sterol-binding domain-containing protein [Thermoanaerobaculaceae bacterium]